MVKRIEKLQSNFLAPPKLSAAEKQSFLVAFANLTEDGIDAFLHRYESFIFDGIDHRNKWVLDEVATRGQSAAWLRGPHLPEKANESARETDKRALWFILETSQQGIRLAWNETDQRRREWRVFELRQHFWFRVMPYEIQMKRVTGWEIPPPLTRFEQCALYFVKHGKMARVCQNKECSGHRYFLATSGKQRYCSDECSAPAKRAAKLRWWNENRKGKK